MHGDSLNRPITTEKNKTAKTSMIICVFVEKIHSTKEAALAIETDKIVITKGTRLEEKIKELLGEKLHKAE